MKWFNGITIYLMIGLLINWFQKASADGKITVGECLNLLVEAAKLMGLSLPTEILELKDKKPDNYFADESNGFSDEDTEEKNRSLKPGEA